MGDGQVNRDITAVALMDATERLLIEGGHAAVTTRRVAEEAGQTHGLIRYHFGSLGELMTATVQRAAGRILDRQRALYERDVPFADKWRTAMSYLESDLTEDGFPKLAMELISLGWNDETLRRELVRMIEEFHEMLSDAVRSALEEYGVGEAGDVEPLAALIRTFQIGIMVERLAGIDVGHEALLKAIDVRLADMHEPTRGDDHESA